MPKLPRVSGAEALKALQRLGFEKVRQSGSPLSCAEAPRAASFRCMPSSRSAPSQVSSGRPTSHLKNSSKPCEGSVQPVARGDPQRHAAASGGHSGFRGPCRFGRLTSNVGPREGSSAWRTEEQHAKFPIQSSCRRSTWRDERQQSASTRSWLLASRSPIDMAPAHRHSATTSIGSPSRGFAIGTSW
jgi:hypothetical protein